MSDPLVVGSALAFVFISFYFYFCTNACQDNTRAQVASAFQSRDCDVEIESELVPSPSYEMVEIPPNEEFEIVIVDPPPPFEDDPPAYETLFPESFNTIDTQVTTTQI